MIGPTNFERLASLGLVCDGIERSWSLTETGAVEERFLLFFDGIDDRVNLIARCAAALGAPSSMIEAWQARFGHADSVGIAFNLAGSSVRLYVQYWDRLVERVQKGDYAPFPLYWGVKSLPDSNLREDVYICLPQASAEVFLPPLQNALAGLGFEPSRAQGLFADLTDETCIFTLINDGARQSWLATVRRAEPNRTAIVDGLAQHFGPAPLPWQNSMMAQAKSGDLLHIAGGQDPLKGKFTTLYFEADAAQMKAALAQTAQTQD